MILVYEGRNLNLRACIDQNLGVGGTRSSGKNQGVNYNLTIWSNKSAFLRQKVTFWTVFFRSGRAMYAIMYPIVCKK